MSGRLTTHVLNSASGEPAAGLEIELWYLGGAGSGETANPELVARRTTNPEGRTDAPLMEGDGLRAGRYRLRFSVGDFFERSGNPGARRFLDIVPVEFLILDQGAHYHVPLLVTPWSYTTYRGR
jgi:5-hydroxyisourate hydrolase